MFMRIEIDQKPRPSFFTGARMAVEGAAGALDPVQAASVCKTLASRDKKNAGDHLAQEAATRRVRAFIWVLLIG